MPTKLTADDFASLINQEEALANRMAMIDPKAQSRALKRLVLENPAPAPSLKVKKHQA